MQSRSVAAMEYREMSIVSAEETTDLLPNHDEQDESYFVEYAIQKEIINRNRTTPTRRLLSQAACSENNSTNNSNVQGSKDFPVISFIHTAGPNWPPSRKREEARALENLRKRVEQSKLCKDNQTPEISGGDATASNSQCEGEPIQQLDNRPNLLKKILSHKTMCISHDITDLQTDWRDSEFITELLCWHNVYRQRHNVPTLTMSPELCEYAQTWANHLAHTNTFYYRNDREVGQNLYCRPGGAVPSEVNGQEVASYWYSAVKQYQFFKELDIFHMNVNAGHFTQVIWASSQLLGVGKARSRSGKIIVVANYQPVGNVSGQFQKNVLPPLPNCGNLPLPPPPRVEQCEEANLSDGSSSDSSSISTQ